MTKATDRRKQFFGTFSSEGECMTIIVKSVETADRHALNSIWVIHLDSTSMRQRDRLTRKSVGFLSLKVHPSDASASTKPFLQSFLKSSSNCGLGIQTDEPSNTRLCIWHSLSLKPPHCAFDVVYPSNHHTVHLMWCIPQSFVCSLSGSVKRWWELQVVDPRWGSQMVDPLKSLPSEKIKGGL